MLKYVLHFMCALACSRRSAALITTSPDGNTINVFAPKARTNLRGPVSANTGPTFVVNGDLFVDGSVGIEGEPDLAGRIASMMNRLDALEQSQP